MGADYRFDGGQSPELLPSKIAKLRHGPMLHHALPIDNNDAG
jgi:hypothetical protein